MQIKHHLLGFIIDSQSSTGSCSTQLATCHRWSYNRFIATGQVAGLTYRRHIEGALLLEAGHHTRMMLCDILYMFNGF